MKRNEPDRRVTMRAIAIHRVWRPLLWVTLVAVTIVTIIRLVGGGPAVENELSIEEPECSIPGILEEGLYSTVPAELLPWAMTWPEDLATLHEAADATRLIAAFRTTLSDPLFDETENVRIGAGYIAGKVLQSGERLSLAQMMGPYTAERGYLDGPMYSGGRTVPSLGGGVCKVATTLYNVAILAGMTIIERHPHSMLVPYVPPGRDAAVAWGHKDLKIQNPYESPVVIWAEVKDLTLFVAMYGSHVPPEVVWKHEEFAREAKPTIRRANSKLDPGEEDVVVEGYDGMTVKTELILTFPDGTVVERNLGVDYYRPMPRVVEYGP